MNQTIVLVKPQITVMHYLQGTLSRFYGCRLLLVLADGDMAGALVEHPEVVIVDEATRRDAIEFSRDLKTRLPHLNVLVLGSIDTDVIFAEQAGVPVLARPFGPVDLALAVKKMFKDLQHHQRRRAS